MTTLPHDRERMFLDDIIDDCLMGRNKLVVVISKQENQSRFLAQQVFRIAENLAPHIAKHIKIFREAVEFDDGGKILFMTYHTGQRLRGLRPDRVVLMGEWGEFWYLLLSTGATIEAVA